MTITIAELGSNNNGGDRGLDYIVTLVDGTQVSLEQQFVPSEIVDGEFTFTIEASTFGQGIVSVEISSTDDGDYYGASFLLNNVQVEYPGVDSVTDLFEYVLQDADGDTDTAVLKIETTDSSNDQIAYETVLERDATDVELLLFNAPIQQTQVANDGTDWSNREFVDYQALIADTDPLTQQITDFVIATEAKEANEAFTPIEVPANTNIFEMAEIFVAQAGGFGTALDVDMREDAAVI